LGQGSGAAQAQSIFEKLVMPGPVIEDHAKLESKCENCHEPFTKKKQKRLCRGCHKDVAADIDSKRGFHGKNPGIANQECKLCHTEHIGRKANIIQLDTELFDHSLTDFQLKGRHLTVRCQSCHKPKIKFSKTPGQCVDCHKKDDNHSGRLGTKCADCHSEKGWLRTKTFDHGKTKFPLVGAHKKVTCSACHVGERYKNLKTTCVSCHQLQDAHLGRYGVKCDTCHQPKKWKSVKFNHDKQTKFPLRGKHTKVKCDACHTGDLYGDKLLTKCVACHKKDDPHKGSLGTKCEECHDETGWRKKAEFDHDLSRFPLIGFHATVSCTECHKTRSFKDTPRACLGCHDDSHHKSRLGPNCSRCHNPNGWTRWRFDHDRNTKFALTGSHIGLDCHACHRAPMAGKVRASTACFGCHSTDDAHRGSFGRNCGRCHTTKSFKQGIRGR